MVSNDVIGRDVELLLTNLALVLCMALSQITQICAVTAIVHAALTEVFVIEYDAELFQLTFSDHSQH